MGPAFEPSQAVGRQHKRSVSASYTQPTVNSTLARPWLLLSKIRRTHRGAYFLSCIARTDLVLGSRKGEKGGGRKARLHRKVIW